MVQQEAVWLITLVLMSLILMVFMFVYARSQQRVEDYTPLKDRAYSLRTKFFWLLVVTLIPTGLYLLTDQPYAKAGDEAKADQVVDVVGYQWRWELSQSEFNAGETVLFRITSADVNHGFGIYDADLRLACRDGQAHWQEASRRLLMTWEGDPAAAGSLFSEWVDEPGSLAL